MAKCKRTSNVPAIPSSKEQREWLALIVVEQAMRQTPEYKAAVKATIRSLKEVELAAQRIARGKKSGE